MNLDDLKPNSFKSKEEAKKKIDKHIESVVSGTVRKRKVSAARKVAGALVSGDLTNVKTYIFTDVLIPSFKKAVCDIVKNGIDILMYGEVKNNSSKPIAAKVSYRNYYNSDKAQNNYQQSYYTAGHSRKGYGYDDIVIPTRGEAEEVKARMHEILEEYGTVSVADMYELCGVTPEFTDNKYGWMDISASQIVRISDGYIIKMPAAVELD